MYKLNEYGVVKLDDNIFIPADPSNRHYQEYLEWVEQGNIPESEFTLDELKTKKIEEMRKKCEETATSGIVSNILGVDYFYPTKQLDQHNLNGLVTAATIYGASLEPYKFWCKNLVTEVWDRVDHTTQQIKDVGAAALNHVRGTQDKYKLKIDSINSANSEEELNIIVW